MDSKTLAAYREALEARKSDLLAQSAASSEGRGPVALDQQSVGRVSRGDALQQQAMSQAQERQRRHELIRIEQALNRIAEDEFGWCTECGEPIAEARLKIDPSVALCVSCAGRA